jgi:hypothetical protein
MMKKRRMVIRRYFALVTVRDFKLGSALISASV